MIPNKLLRIILVGVLLSTSFICNAQISTCAYYDGYWGEWKQQYYTYSRHSWYKLYGNYSGFIVYYDYRHPSEYIFKFQIDRFVPPSKEEIKKHWKNNLWYEYDGYVEYFIDKDYPNIKTALKRFSFAFISSSSYNTKRTARAKIKIAPYKKHPKVYNIFFEDVGIAIDLESTYF